MKYEADIRREAGSLLQRSFELTVSADDGMELKEVRRVLIEKIKFLLDHDFEKLISILYRIDVPEEKAKRALATSPEKNPADVLADLIIERQVQKVKSRTEFGSGDGSEDYNVGE